MSQNVSANVANIVSACYHLLGKLHVRYYGQSWYKYWICIVACPLICRDLLRDRGVDEGLARLTYGWTKARLLMTQDGPNKILGGNLTCFRNRYR